MIEFDPIKHLAISHAFGGGMYIKQCELPVGFTFAQHRHNFDHLSILASGKAIVEVDGVETEFVGPTMLTIKANKIHSITPITPVLWFCCHAVGEDGDIETDFVKDGVINSDNIDKTLIAQ